MNVKLYRAVSYAEFSDIMLSRRFNIVANSLEGKWFAERFEDARKWGEAFSRLSGIPHDKIVVAEFERAVADQFFRIPFLDEIGPARFATIDECAYLISVSEATP